ncbi:hypothetical protein FRC12_017467 [Ceratobasidium sp. 428]|nr:hypothetical protein FRC12_017467 [Ceratobasidium sp. 428]
MYLNPSSRNPPPLPSRQLSPSPRRLSPSYGSTSPCLPFLAPHALLPFPAHPSALSIKKFHLTILITDIPNVTDALYAFNSGSRQIPEPKLINPAPAPPSNSGTNVSSSEPPVAAASSGRPNVVGVSDTIDAEDKRVS